jgi:Toprim domain/CHC2 zinc finger
MSAVVLDALMIATALGGKKQGRAYWVCCPAHAERTPSLKLEDTSDGRLLVKCFGAAQCSQESVINALKSQGLWPGRTEPIDHEELERRCPERIRRRTEDGQKRLIRARSIWHGAKADKFGDLVERYLAGRGIGLERPATLRSGLVWHPEERRKLAAMVAPICGSDRKLRAVHATFIERRSGGGVAKANLDPAKVIYGLAGCGAVRLALSNPGKPLGLAEGIESALSAMQLHGIPVWAAAYGGNLGRIVVPADVSEIVIFADRDPNGAGQWAGTEAARTYAAQGFEVRVELPSHGGDFNDMLARSKAEAAV